MVCRTRRLLLLAGLACALVALAAPTAALPAQKHALVTLSGVDSGVLRGLNGIRAQYGLAALQVSLLLTASATQHSREMGARGYFEHTSADGTLFWKRIAGWYDSAGFGYWSVGENLLWSSPGIGSAAALRLWMASPEHRRNILNPEWREVGIAAFHFRAAPGLFGGAATTIITTDFGVRR
jgi:uncharacterized protein YkwD